MTAKDPTPVPEGIRRPSPPAPPPLRVGANGYPCPICASGMKPKRFLGGLFGVFSGCYNDKCENYWRR